MTTGSATARGRREARRAANSAVVSTAARAGFVARGVIYLLIGILTLRIAVSDGGDRQADRGGAIAEIAGNPFGSVLLWLLGIALAGMAVWRLSEAAVGQTGPDGRKASKRALAAGRSVFYGFVSYSVLAYAAGDTGSGSGSSDKNSHDITAKVLDWPAGQWIVALAGGCAVAAGAWIAVRAIAHKFQEHLEMSGMTQHARHVVNFLGVFGGASRGIVFAVAGGFAIVAAVQHNPGKAKGMDDTLRSFTDTPAGPWLLLLIAIGLAAFGLFSWANARWRKI